MHRLPRILLLVTVYAVSLLLLWKVVGAEDFTGPCRGTFSCRLDEVLALASYLCAAVLNLYVFEAVLLCTRWISSLARATEGWPQKLTERLKLQSVENVAKARELMKIELIAQRTEVVNRLVRYPFIVLLIMMVARNQYFDNWNFPLTMVVGWAVNVALALAAALLFVPGSGAGARCWTGAAQSAGLPGAGRRVGARCRRQTDPPSYRGH